MRFACSADQRHFFQKNHFIEFEEVLLDHAAEVKQEAESIIAKRLEIAPTAYALFKAGHDLWRESAVIRKATQKLSIVDVAADLFETPVLRIAFDQFFDTHFPFSTALPLIDISSIKPLAGAIFFALDEMPDNPFPFPKKLGNALFVSPQFSLPWNTLPRKHIALLCVAFATKKSIYSPALRDPHAPLLKKMGYAYNAFLKDETHPILSGRK
jgi:hypothetical protein